MNDIIALKDNIQDETRQDKMNLNKCQLTHMFFVINCPVNDQMWLFPSKSTRFFFQKWACSLFLRDCYYMHLINQDTANFSE